MLAMSDRSTEVAMVPMVSLARGVVILLMLIRCIEDVHLDLGTWPSTSSYAIVATDTMARPVGSARLAIA